MAWRPASPLIEFSIPNSLALLKKQFAIYERDAVVDWNFNPAPTIEDEIPKMAEQGIAAFKIFMVVDTGRSYPHMPGIGVHDHGRILEIMQACAKVNVPLMVHPHDQALMDVIEKEFWERQQRDALAWAIGLAGWEVRTVLRRSWRRRETGNCDTLLELQTDAASPEDAAIAADLAAILGKTLATLRPPDVEALLRDVRGERVGGAGFRKRLQRARERMRAAWRQRYG